MSGCHHSFIVFNFQAPFVSGMRCLCSYPIWYLNKFVWKRLRKRGIDVWLPNAQPAISFKMGRTFRYLIWYVNGSKTWIPRFPSYRSESKKKKKCWKAWIDRNSKWVLFEYRKVRGRSRIYFINANICNNCEYKKNHDHVYVNAIERYPFNGLTYGNIWWGWLKSLCPKCENSQHLTTIFFTFFEPAMVLWLVVGGKSFATQKIRKRWTRQGKDEKRENMLWNVSIVYVGRTKEKLHVLNFMMVIYQLVWSVV